MRRLVYKFDRKLNYYDILGVASDASQEDIKKAYRKMAKAYHPDLNKTPEAGLRFKEINEANQVLSAPDRRARYDRDVLILTMHRKHEQEKRTRYQQWKSEQKGSSVQSINRIKTHIHKSVRWSALNRMKNRLRRFLK